MRLQEATDALNGFGEIYMAQAMASGVIPIDHGSIWHMRRRYGTHPGYDTDFTFMESKKRKLFVNSPNALDGKPRIQM